LNQDIQHLAVTIDSTPQIHAFAIDGDKHLVKMPSPIWSGSRASKLVCISQTELYRPAPDALVGDIYAALGEKVFDIPEAQGKPEIQPDGVLNDRWWKSVSGIGDFLHPVTVLCSLSPVTKLV
jgi:hypothetical protein